MTAAVPQRRADALVPEGWAPTVSEPPVVTWPPRPIAAARWFVGVPGYLFPWNLLYGAVAAALWFLATPSTDTMASLELGWIVFLLARNVAVVAVWFGAWHLWLYRRRAQGAEYKFQPRWPAGRSARFTFGGQLRDNVFWSLASGVPIFTAWEAVTLWLFSSGRIGWLDPGGQAVWFALWFLLIPLVREVHFFAVHRLIHWPPLYRAVHSLHHRNTNPSPWSGLSMHPVEHLLYFSVVAVCWVVPSHPLHAMFIGWHAVLAPAPGHAGFDRVELGRAGVDTNGYAHYLHHKLFEVNYGDGVLPLDRWFGSFHDGSPEADEAMRARRARARTTAD